MPSALANACLLLAALVAAPSRADQAPAGGAFQGTTRVEGAVPDLQGRWVVVVGVTVPGDQGTVIAPPQLWSVTAQQGKPAVEPRSVQLPPFLLDAIAAANAQHRPWEPTVPELERLRAEWDALSPEDRGLASVETVLLGPDAFTPEMKADDKMRDARFIIQQTATYRPGSGRPIRDVALHGVTETTPLGYGGSYSSVSIAAAPFAVTIPFSGTFRMYRLESLPAPGLLARLLDAFAGCGRRAR